MAAAVAPHCELADIAADPRDWRQRVEAFFGA
jgi:hypothetical protein